MLDQKINTHFAGKAVRKDLTFLLKGNAVVPSYVLEFLLGQYCASDEEEVIQAGLETVREVLARHFVHRDEAELIKGQIRDRGRYRIIDKVEAVLNERKDCYEASFSNLGLRRVLIDDDSVKDHPKLLTGGVWCIIDLSYFFTDDKNSTPWIIEKLKPIQISHVDIEGYKALRREFSTHEWIDLLMQSLGLNPEQFTRRTKLLQLTRLIPFCENNYNLIELGPKGTGKSHVYSEFSPHGILISGGDVTQAKLFVNNASGNIGLVGFWDTVAFDEFAGKDKRVDKKLVDIMKNYMANKSFSRGRDMYSASASMTFVGNTDHPVGYMLRHSHLFESLPKGYLDSAFLDRIHFYVPGWEVQKLRSEMFTSGYGFIVDYLAEVLKALRKEDYGQSFLGQFDLSDSLTSRDKDGVTKTLSGLIKLIYPHGDFTKKELRGLLEFSMEGRQRVKQQLLRIDKTFEAVDFGYTDLETGQVRSVECLEETELRTQEDLPEEVIASPGSPAISSPAGPERKLHKVEIREDQKGISYDRLFGPYLRGAKAIILVDPYIRYPYQVNNLFEFALMLLRIKPADQEMHLHLITKTEERAEPELEEKLIPLAEGLSGSGLTFTYEIDQDKARHDRWIQADSGWKISLSRGIDIFNSFDYRDRFNPAKRLQEFRPAKENEVVYEPVGS